MRALLTGHLALVHIVNYVLDPVNCILLQYSTFDARCTINNRRAIPLAMEISTQIIFIPSVQASDIPTLHFQKCRREDYLLGPNQCHCFNSSSVEIASNRFQKFKTTFKGTKPGF